MAGLVTIGTPPQFEIARSLQEISKNLDHAIGGFKKPLVRTIDEAEFESREARDRRAAMKRYAPPEQRRLPFAKFLKKLFGPRTDGR
jgi:hypothetical protein